MPNLQYQKGRRREYKWVEKLRKLGYDYVGRTAGSHGLFDVYGIDVSTRTIRLIQVKSGETAEREKTKARPGIEALTGTYYVEGVVES